MASANAAMAHNIEMNYYDSATSTYIKLYPKTLGNLVEGTVSNSTKLNGYTYSQVISNASSGSSGKVGWNSIMNSNGTLISQKPFGREYTARYWYNHIMVFCMITPPSGY